MDRRSDLIRRVTDNFFFWQGLRWVPMGGLILALVAMPRGWPKWAELGYMTGVVLVAYVASTGVGRYYRRSFGSVTATPGLHRSRSLLKWTVFLPGLVAALVIDVSWEPPVFLSGLAMAGLIVGYWWSTGRGRSHYLVFAFLHAVLAFVPLVGLAQPGLAMFPWLWGLVGVTYVVGGLLDHRELLAVLPQPPDERQPASL
jgi:hypothetical protein